MGLTGLDGINDVIAINFRNYQAFRQELAGIPCMHMVAYDETERNNFQYIILEIDELLAGINRDLIVRILHAENILARRYFYPGCHQMEPYRSLFPHAGLLLPETEKLVKRVISLPTGTAVTTDDIKKICQIIRFVTENGNTVSKRLSNVL
jgi:dTDP-4-amino-4,6-dideoxygalactose transaminase